MVDSIPLSFLAEILIPKCPSIHFISVVHTLPTACRWCVPWSFVLSSLSCWSPARAVAWRSRDGPGWCCVELGYDLVHIIISCMYFMLVEMCISLSLYIWYIYNSYIYIYKHTQDSYIYIYRFYWTYIYNIYHPPNQGGPRVFKISKWVGWHVFFFHDIIGKRMESQWWIMMVNDG